MKKLLLLFFAYALLTVVFTYPAVFHLSDKVIGDGGDNYQFLSFQYLATSQIQNGQFPFGWTNYWRYPVGFDFSTGYDSTLLLLTGLFLYPVFIDPVLVYNLSVLIFFILNCFFSYLFFQKMTKNTLLGFIGGVIYGFSFYNLARGGGHSNLLMTGFIPLLGFSLITLYERKGDLKSFTLLTFSFILVYLTSLQYLLLTVGAMLFFIPIFFACYKKEFLTFIMLLLKRKLFLILSITITALVFILFNFHRITALFTNNLILPSPDIVTVPLINYFLPNIYIKTLINVFANSTRQWIEYAVFLGFGELLFFLFFLFVNDKRIKIFIVLNILVFFLLSTGSLLYPYLFAFLPFRGIIEPGRFYIIFYLFFTLGILLFLQKIYSNKTFFYSAVSVLSIFVFLERLPKTYYLSDNLYDKTFIKAVRTTNSTAVLDLPVFTEWWNGNRYDLYSIYYQKPIVNGYIQWSGNTEPTKTMLKKLSKFECSMDPNFKPFVLNNSDVLQEKQENKQIISELMNNGITTIVFHKNLSESNGCKNAVKKIQILLDVAKAIKLFENKEKTVYSL